MVRGGGRGVTKGSRRSRTKGEAKGWVSWRRKDDAKGDNGSSSGSRKIGDDNDGSNDDCDNKSDGEMIMI